jgi:hypothetical protein
MLRWDLKLKKYWKHVPRNAPMRFWVEDIYKMSQEMLRWDFELKTFYIMSLNMLRWDFELKTFYIMSQEMLGWDFELKTS